MDDAVSEHLAAKNPTCEHKRNKFKEEYGISDDMCFANYKDLFAKGKLAYSFIICTQDKMHLEPTLPIATIPQTMKKAYSREWAF
jgi:hypothetical protein